MLARVLYRDGLMLIVDKPAGLAVHRGPKGGASLEDYFDALRFGLPRPPSLAHRLDKDTSGCLVLGRHRKALAHLGLLFKHGKVGKTYWAVVEGGPDADEGRVELSLGRLDETRGWWMKPDPKGLPSVHNVASTGAVIGHWHGRRYQAHLARSHPSNRPHPPAPRSLRRQRMADRMATTSMARRRALPGRRSCFTRVRSWCRFRKQSAGAGHGAGAGAYAGLAACLRLER